METVTGPAGFPCIDLYARPRSQRQQSDRFNRFESLWVGISLAAMLGVGTVMMGQQLSASSTARAARAEIRQLEAQKSEFEAVKATYVRSAEIRHGMESRLVGRSGWLRLVQAVSGITNDREALEQCTLNGLAQRTVVLTGSARDLVELEDLVQRLKAVSCLKGVRLTETAANTALGATSVHFRVEARCDAADLAREALGP